MVTQFCQGDSVEYNDVSRYFIETSRDMHYVNGLMSDTKQSRRDNFKSCLNELGDYVKQKKNIRKVIFPTGVGRRGKMDHEWNVAYLKELRLDTRLDKWEPCGELNKAWADELGPAAVRWVVIVADSGWPSFLHLFSAFLMFASLSAFFFLLGGAMVTIAVQKT